MIAARRATTSNLASAKPSMMQIARSRSTWRPKLGSRVALGLLLVALALLLAIGSAAAKCLPIAGLEPRVIPAALPAAGTLRLTFLGHSSFLIESAEGVTAVTDYNGWVRPPAPPDIVTMNNAHDTHYTDYVEPEVALALRGWDPEGGMAVHEHQLRDLKVWNLPTNVRDFGGVRYNGNSIFVFEIADLCIAHLGHLHHLLTDEHLGQLGVIDVVLAPIDGAYTMAQELMVQVIEQIGAPTVIPMHYFGNATLARFLEVAKPRYGAVYSKSSSIILERGKLPYRKILVLPPREAGVQFYSDD